MSEAKLIIDVTGEPQVQVLAERLTALAAENVRLNQVIQAGQAAYNEERVARDWLARENARLIAAIGPAPSDWPQMRIVRLGDDVAEIRIGGARWVIPGDRWNEASDFLARVRALWDMRVVWADAGTPVDGDCAKRLLAENERLRRALKKAVDLWDEFDDGESYAHVVSDHIEHWRAMVVAASESNTEEKK